MGKREYTHVVHVSQLNKILLTKHCREELFYNIPELRETKVSENRIVTALIKYYLGGNYFDIKSKVEHEIEASKK